MAETEELTRRRWTRFDRADTVERIISGHRRALVTEVSEMREGDLIHVVGERDSVDGRDVWVRVTDRADRVLSIEVDDARYG